MSSTTPRFAMTRRSLAALFLSASVTAGCSDSDDGPKESSAAGDAWYVVSTGVSVGDEFVGYLASVPSLDAETNLDLDNAIEIEPSWIFSKQGQPHVYAASLLSPTIIRYSVSDEGKMVPDKTVSFANFGLQSAYLAAGAPIYSDEKSYFVDDLQDQIVIWNPKRMETIGTIPLDDGMDGKLPPAAEGTIVIHDGLILTVIYWLDPNDDPSLYGSHVRLIAIDPKTDEIVSSTDDTRLTHAAPLGRATDGSLFYSPGSFISAEAVVGEGHGSPSRLLRVGPQESTFDADFDLDLSALVGGRPAGDYTLLNDDTALIRAWHGDLADTITDENWKDVLWSQAGFMWWRWHVGDAEAVQIPDQTPAALGSSVFSLDGKTYVLRTSADSASTTLDEIDDQGGFRPALTGPGQFIGNVIRVR